MFGITVNICVFIYATLMAIECVLGQQHHQHHYYKPWPTYSLQNMPQTRFTCHDKILGGYYADPETQCQMFHVCVKAAGGVQDFRFLCPNSTAFDQEAQICADWGDIDCEQSVLYYGSDNFDLYRIGSGFESKRAPLAEEEEATFHLQRAESADIRRSKETRVDQKLRPDQTSQLSYTKHLTTSTTRNPDTYANLAAQRNPQRNNYNNYKNNNNNNNNYNYNNNYNNNNDDDIVDDVRRLSPDAITKQPIVNFYTPTTSTTTSPTTTKPKPTTTTSTTTTTTTERYTDESKQDLDEIFKGSHSSHYFANRNGGREDDFQDLPTKTKQNDFSDYSRKLAETSTSGKTRVQPTRGGNRGRIQHLQQQQQHQQQSHFSTPSTTQRSTTTTKLIKNFTQTPTFYQTDFKAFAQNQFQKASTPTTPPPTPTTTATNLGGSAISNANRFSLNSHDFQTQEKILPTTYNPASSVYRIKATTPKYPEASRDRDAGSGTETHKNNNLYSGQYDFGSSSGKTAPAANQSRRKPQKTLLTSPQNSSFVNHDEFAEFAKIKTQEPQPFKPAQVFRPPPLDSVKSAPTRSSLNQTEPRARSRGQATKLPATSYQEPKPFSAPQRQRGGSNTPNQSKQQLKSTSSSTGGATSNAQPRGFTSRGSINYKATTQRSGDNNDHNNNYTPSSHAPKKFSTLVPKDQQQYQPTTFKPTTYKKAYDNSFYQTQQTGRPVAGKTQQILRATSTTAATPVGTSTADPHHKPGEDDGQYHPELYELDFPKNRLKLQRSTTTTTTTKAPNASKLKSSTNSNNNNNYQYSQTHLKTQQQNFFQQQQQQPDSDSIDLSDEEELFKTAQSLNFGAASINKLRADIFKAEKTSQQYNSQYAPNQSNLGPVQTAAPSYLPTTSSAVFSYPTYAPSTTLLLSTAKPFAALTTTTAAPLTAPTTSPTTAANTIATRITTTTRSPPPAAAASHGVTQGPQNFVTKSHKGGSKKGSNKAKKTQKSASKRPPHADDDTSYDYAYYDSDSLSESPQTYPDYEIAEFVKTRKN